MIMGPDRPSTCTKRLFKCHIHIFGSTSLRLDDPFRVLMITERGYVMLLNRMNGIKTG